MRSFRAIRLALAAAALLGAAPAAQADFIKLSQTLRERIDNNPLVLDAAMTAEGTNAEQLKARITVKEVIKGPAKLKPDTAYTAVGIQPEYAQNGPIRVLVIGSLQPDGTLAVSLSEPKASPALIAYVKALVALPARKGPARAAFYLRHVGDSDVLVRWDAACALVGTRHADLRPAARELTPETVLRWMKGAEGDPVVTALCGVLLGMCGRDEHADYLEKVLRRDAGPQLVTDGVLCGLTMLRPGKGLDTLRAMLHDPGRTFLSRYAALRVVRFLADERPDLLLRADLVAALVPLLEQQDMADLVIEDLRRWQRWELTASVLRLAERRDGLLPITRRAVVRFALDCPEPSAAEFLRRERRLNPDLVRAVEEMIEIENDICAPVRKGVLP